MDEEKVVQAPGRAEAGTECYFERSRDLIKGHHQLKTIPERERKGTNSLNSLHTHPLISAITPYCPNQREAG